MRLAIEIDPWLCRTCVRRIENRNASVDVGFCAFFQRSTVRAFGQCSYERRRSANREHPYQRKPEVKS